MNEGDGWEVNEAYDRVSPCSLTAKKTQNKWEREGNVHACENDSSCTTTRSALKSMCGIALWDCVIGILFL